MTLSQRVAGLVGPDREATAALFMEAWEAINGAKPSIALHPHKADPSQFMRFLECGAFLDAAAMLVPEGYDFGCGSGVSGLAWCGLSNAPNSYVFAATPALALASAALSTRGL